ncbi:unnamed protein product, partial [Cuscuta europaea]
MCSIYEVFEMWNQYVKALLYAYISLRNPLNRITRDHFRKKKSCTNSKYLFFHGDIMPPRRDPNAVPTNAELAQTVHLLTQLTHTIANAVLQNNQPRNNSNDMETRVATRNPPSFLGQEDPIILENWIRTFDKLFDAINCPAEERVDIAVYYLHEEADKWWVNVGLGLRAQPDFTWERFKQALRKRFYPPHVQAENYDKFLHLKQGEMTVQEYHTKFVSLAEFASSLVPDEESKIEK